MAGVFTGDIEDLWSEAFKEAAVSAPHTFIYHTLELYHPGFLDEDGEVVSVRVVLAQDSLWAGLEADAPREAGQLVEFLAGTFEFELATTADNEVPQLNITVDNVGGTLVTKIDSAVIDSADHVDVIYRPYVEGELDAPDMDPVLHFTMETVSVNKHNIQGTASLTDLLNKGFPGELYRGEKFPFLLSTQ